MKREQLEALAAKLEDWSAATQNRTTGEWFKTEDFGEGWLIASFGKSGSTARETYVQTRCHASDLQGDAETDALFLLTADEAFPVLIKIARAFLREKLTESGS